MQTAQDTSSGSGYDCPVTPDDYCAVFPRTAAV
jgi:hypothetical protein